MTKRKPDTLLAHAGRRPSANHGVVNPPVYHASTILFPTVAALHDSQKRRAPAETRYGRYGTPTTFALEEAIAALDDGGQSIVVSSGVAAVSAALMAFVKSGDHILMVDSVYGPTRRFCNTVLARFGVTTTYYDPLIGAGIAGLIQKNTRIVFLESPGSGTFEIQDVPAIVAAARRAKIATMMDNTWATPLYFRPLAHGVDVSILSATKYIGGHSDLMMGIITASADTYPRVRRAVDDIGSCSGPDDCYLALRGLRTMSVRLQRHQENGLALARWLQKRPEVARVMHPALPEDRGHKLWKRDFTGASGLFGLELRKASDKAIAAMLDGLELFGMGYSWGGFESLVIPFELANIRTATQATGNPLLRIHAGLEDPQDLIADLEKGFARLRRAGGKERKR